MIILPKKKTVSISPRIIAFAHHYIQSGGDEEFAVKNAGFTVKDTHRKAQELLKHEKVKEIIGRYNKVAEKEMEKKWQSEIGNTIADETEVLQMYTKIARGQESEDFKGSDRINALKEVGKALGLNNEDKGVTVNVTYESKLKELLEDDEEE